MADRDRREAPVCTRTGAYSLPLPERQSALSIWCVRAECAIIVISAIAVLFYLNKPKHQDTAPLKIASAPMMSPINSATGTASTETTASTEGADPGKGHVLYMQSCTSCHGQSAQGLPHMGVNLRDNKFVAAQSDRKLVAFLKVGRKPVDPKNTTGLLMPPRGGNVSLDDDSLADIVAFLRQVQKEHAQETATAEASAGPTSRPVARNDTDSTTGARAE